MDNLLSSSLRALRSLTAPGMFGVMVVCVLATIVALVLFVILFVPIGAAVIDYIAWMLHPTGDTSGFAVLGALFWGAVLAWFLFPGIMPVVVNFFGERIMGIIERHDYPTAAPAREPAFLPELLHDAKFSLIAIGLNILALPLYLVPVVNLFLFYLLNGWLLGREFFVMAARRHMPPGEADLLRKRHGRLVMAAGIALTFLATIPFINLFAPFWGIAVMTHLYHRLAENHIKSIR